MEQENFILDTNNKENNRVVFHGPIDAETTPLLDEALFTESLSDESLFHHNG